MIDWGTELAERVADWRARLMLLVRPQGTIDFETRSTCSLTKHGAWLYSMDPDTEAMCLAYKLPCYDRPRLWHMAHPQHLISQSPPPLELFAFILAGGLVEAHNAFFERCIWKNVMVRRHDWPEVDHLQWRCSAAKASMCSLPRKLEMAVVAMRLPEEKDTDGGRLMRKMTKPRKMLKAEIKAWAQMTGWKGRLPGKDSPVLSVVWHEEEEDLYTLWGYCEQDVVAEEGLSEALPDLPPGELALWQLDQKMNERGARFDMELARSALDLAEGWKAKLNKELEVMTGISAATKRQQVKAWLLEHEGVDLPDTKADTLNWCLEHWGLEGRSERIVYIMKEVNRTSTRKYQDMLNKADHKWMVRDLLMYHGAHSGRWTGKGVQIHNFPRGALWTNHMVGIDEICDDIILADSVDWLEAMYSGEIMELLSHALRGTAVSAPGYDLIVADYAAIEARCILWEAGATAALDVFRRGEDIYCDMASGIYGYKVEKKTHPNERQFGKQAILGLGYGMGFVTFLLTCRRYNIHFSREDVLRIMGVKALEKMEIWVRNHLDTNKTVKAGKTRDSKGNLQARKVRRRLADAREKPDEITHELALMKHVVNVYRERYPEVKALWKDQEAAVILAIRSRRKSTRIECGKVTWWVENDFLHGQLPSGRIMYYRDPQLKMIETSWGEMKEAIRYKGVIGTGAFKRIATYGGKVAENITQAIARDILAHALILADAHPTYDPAFHVHDELVCEVREGEGSIEEFEGLMANVPIWAQDCPIEAGAERYKRWRKG